MNACIVEGCDNPHRARGWCRRHYQYFTRKGVEPSIKLNTRGLPLEQRIEAYQTKGPGCWLWTGAHGGGEYGDLKVNGRMRKVHVLVYEIEHGPVPDGFEVDHICRNKGCSRPSHLRLATRKQNLENLSGANRNNTTSGVRGVHWSKSTNKWAAQVTHNYRRHHGGYFTDLEQAAEAARQLRLSLFTHNDADRHLDNTPRDAIRNIEDAERERKAA